MPEDNEAEETISFFCHMFVIDEILNGVGVAGAGPMATPMCWAVLF